MKAVLVHPPMTTMTDRKISPPLGLLYLAAYLRERMDVEIQVIDQNLNDDISETSCIRQVIAADGDVYGISFATPQYGHAVAIARAIRKHRPQCLVVCGGPHPSALPFETLKDTLCDAVVESEGEETLLDVIRHAMGEIPLDQVLGLYFLGKDGGLQYTGTRPFIHDLDILPFPARDLVDFRKYTRTINGEAAATLITARGCPGRCIFCSQHTWKHKLRLRSVDNIMAEIDQVGTNFGIRNFLFLDDTLTANKKRIYRLCDELRKRRISWRGWTRANMVSPPLLSKMAEADCVALCIGVESGSQRILDNLHKGTTVEENRRAVLAIKEAGIKARITLIVGSPGETWESIQETISFVLDVEPDDWLVSIFVPVPGSEAYKDPSKYGIRLLSTGNRIDYYSHFFVTGGEMMSGQVMEYEHLSREEILEMRNYVYDVLMEKCPPRLHRPEGLR